MKRINDFDMYGSIIFDSRAQISIKTITISIACIANQLVVLKISSGLQVICLSLKMQASDRVWHRGPGSKSRLSTNLRGIRKWVFYR